LRIAFLASGSSGNSLYIEGNDTQILIDAGLSGKQVRLRMEQINADPKDLNAILVTHEHNDHVKGVGVMARRYDLPVFATPGTWSGIGKKIGNIGKKKVFERGDLFEIGGIRIHSFATSHDANEPTGFSIQIDKYKIGIATDLGFVSRLVGRRLEGSNVIVLESNHDIEMLKKGSYPWHLKQRILSRYGHLSNFNCNDALNKLAHSELEVIGLAHLSKENNDPNLVENEGKKLLKKLKRESIRLVVGNQDEARVIMER
jgi:phosphoribosyl 1,2-cyclic phosphodiesterase